MEYVFYDSDDVHVGTVTNRIEDCAGLTPSAPSAPKAALPAPSQMPATPAAAESTRWTTLERSERGFYQAEQEGGVRKGGTVRVWTRAFYENPIAVSVDSIRGAYASYVLSLNGIDCAERTETVRKTLYADKDGQPIPGAEKGRPSETADIVPGTPKDKVLRFVCSPRK